MKIEKYFWNLNDKALRETRGILKDPRHPKFLARITNLLSRCDRPRELFSLVSKEEFIEAWPKIRAYWAKIARESDFRDWWETIYEQLVRKSGLRPKGPKGRSASFFLKIGKTIREARVEKGLSQKELSLRTRMKQPDISAIEDGKKNITIETLVRLAKVLELKRIDIDV